MLIVASRFCAQGASWITVYLTHCACRLAAQATLLEVPAALQDSFTVTHALAQSLQQCSCLRLSFTAPSTCCWLAAVHCKHKLWPYLCQSQVHGSGDVEQHACGRVYAHFQQRAGDGVLSCLQHPAGIVGKVIKAQVGRSCAASPCPEGTLLCAGCALAQCTANGSWLQCGLHAPSCCDAHEASRAVWTCSRLSKLQHKADHPSP